MGQRSLLIILGITLVYAGAWLAYYGQIPAGQSTSQAAQATLNSALALAEGRTSLTAEPQTHSLYTYTLSWLAHFCDNDKSLTTAARALNTLALIIATSFCTLAAGRYWRRNRTAWLAGLLVGLNPVLMFWTGEISPCLLATAAISIAVNRSLHWLRHPKALDSLWVSASLLLASAFETSLLPFALVWPICALLITSRKRLLNFSLAAAPLAIATGLMFATTWQLQTPWSWHTQDIGTEIYKALSNQEAQDDKSFSLYRQLHFLLLLNPIHWGLLIILAGGGCYTRIKDGYRARSVILAIAALALFSVSLALNNSGSQARATVIPLLAIFAAGASLLPKIWQHASSRTQSKIIIGGVLLTLFSYGYMLSSQEEKTWEQDYIYLAQAHMQYGSHDRALTWAQKALELNPDRIDMQAILIRAQFNDWALQQRTLPIENAKNYLAASQSISGTPIVESIQAIYQYKLHESAKALATWQTQRHESALALLCLYWTGSIEEITIEEVNSHKGKAYFELLQAASEVDRDALKYSTTEKLIDNILAFAY